MSPVLSPLTYVPPSWYAALLAGHQGRAPANGSEGLKAVSRSSALRQVWAIYT